MRYRLRAGLSFCFVGERPVFLDVDCDRYFMLQGELESAFKTFAAGVELSSESLRVLEGTRILESSLEAANAPLPPSVSAPVRSLLEESAGVIRVGPWTTAAAMFALLSSRRRLRREGFARSIGRLGSKNPGRAAKPALPDGAIESLATDFLAARCAFPAPPNCLPDSLALLDFLNRRGAHADLVIGVRLDPYAAHCWVQCNEILLNEALDHAASFTPILVA